MCTDRQNLLYLSAIFKCYVTQFTNVEWITEIFLPNMPKKKSFIKNPIHCQVSLFSTSFVKEHRIYKI